MAKSTGNNILPEEMFSGNNPIFSKAFSPMVVRFFMLQAHYRSIVDISEEALLASEKGFKRLMEGVETLKTLSSTTDSETSFDVEGWKSKCYAAMNDDFNSPLLIAHLFDAIKHINTIANEGQSIQEAIKIELEESIHAFIFDVLGLKSETAQGASKETIKLESTVTLLLELRAHAKENRDFATADRIRQSLVDLGIQVNDTPEGATFKLN